MSTTTDLSTLKINYLTQAQYDTATSQGVINDDEIYMTPNTSTSIPTSNTGAEFDSSAHMNSSDMTTGSGGEVESFVNNLDFTASGSLPIGVDYIVEQGTTNSWYWRKWNSGIAECWTNYSDSIEVNLSSPGYGGYRSAELSVAFPFTFTATPTTTATTGSGSNGAWVNNSQPNTTTWKGYLSAGASLSATSRTIQIYAIGTWK